MGLDELTQIQIGSSVLVAGAQKGDSKFYSWLYRIAFNRGVNFYRSVRVWDEIDDEYPDTAVTANPERVLIGIEKERKVLEVIDLMPDVMREALTLNTYRGYDYKTVSQLVTVTIGMFTERWLAMLIAIAGLISANKP